jgi:hypothetical protein
MWMDSNTLITSGTPPSARCSTPCDHLWLL